MKDVIAVIIGAIFCGAVGGLTGVSLVQPGYGAPKLTGEVGDWAEQRCAGDGGVRKLIVKLGHNATVYCRSTRGGAAGSVHIWDFSNKREVN